MDCLVKVWDLPSGKLIDCLKFENAPTSICFSPTSEFLATTHVNLLGIYLWSNKSLYCHVPLKQLDNEYEPENLILLPTTSEQMCQNGDSDTFDEANKTDDYLIDDKNYLSPQQLDLELITLSLLPESRWKHLVNLDTIKVRQ